MPDRPSVAVGQRTRRARLRTVLAVGCAVSALVGCSDGPASTASAPSGRPTLGPVVPTGSAVASPTVSAAPPTLQATPRRTVEPRATATSARPRTPPAVRPRTPRPSPELTVAQRWTVRRVTAADLGSSWRSGCPVGPAQLREVTVPLRGFDGVRRTGRLVVHADVADQIGRTFVRIFDAGFPIRRMVPVQAYGSDDGASMAADNTSAFNCRRVEGTSRWSQHAYGRALDVNPVENPYVDGDEVDPPAGRPYADRSRVRPGMVMPGGSVDRAFAAIGWPWGGRWSSAKDYQHFSSNGR